jgi:two-component system OmpR family response regulator
MRILIVEDDTEIAAYVAKGLSESGYSPDYVTSAEEAMPALEAVSYDAIIIDLMLPGIDGEDFINSMRKKAHSMPVLVLSAKQSVEDRVHSLRIGADDYMTKPFSFSELSARMEALIRRAHGVEQSQVLQLADLELDKERRTVSRGGKEIDLPPREFALLEYMLYNKERVLPKTMILEHIWDFDFDPQTNVLDVLVHRLRKKVDEPFDKALIHTVRGVGYVMRDEQ